MTTQAHAPRRTRRAACLVATLLGGSATTALAQSNVDAANKYCWSENAGWLNWRDAGSPPGAQGVKYVYTYFTGFAWAENLGYVNFGLSPASTPYYSNATGADFGVNIDTDGRVFGLAWSENAGWINFDIPPLVPLGRHASYDPSARRLRGYAWGENVGWMNLDIAVDGQFVGVNPCPLDYNLDGDLNPDDLGDYITDYYTDPPVPGPGGYAIPCPDNDPPYDEGYKANFTADYSGQCNPPFPDNLGDYITAYFQGC